VLCVVLFALEFWFLNMGLLPTIRGSAAFAAASFANGTGSEVWDSVSNTFMSCATLTAIGIVGYLG
jgi:hypothetical protein